MFEIQKENQESRQECGSSGHRPAFAADVWGKALESLKSTVSKSDLGLWLEPIKAGVRDDRFVLFCPDPYFAAYVARHFLGAIQAAMQHAGIADFSTQDLVVEERIPPAAAQRRQASEAAAQFLDSLPPEEQFRRLEAEYPHNPVWPDKRRTLAARKAFLKLAESGEISSFSGVLGVVRMMKQSKGWRINGGEFIPGLWRFINEKQWVQDVA
ncbi:MAG TPA: hypothetical protein DEB25_06405 [Desulfobulbaceae bacterium]|nr:hypothetical protein [Desulfobulbaceae bacterium]